MNEQYLKELAYQDMVKAIKKMTSKEITMQLQKMQCCLSYEDIAARLAKTYNDLAVADAIFEQYEIIEARYPKTFIDEVVLEIAQREKFGFLHYGLLSTRIRDIMELNIDHKAKLAEAQMLFRKLCQCAKIFKQTALEAMIYEVNDGVDLYAYLMQLLDDMMVEARSNRNYCKTIISFTEKLLSTFTNSSPFLRISIQYEQANAYIVMKSKKGEMMYQQLLTSHSDPCDVVFHYALAYLDDDEQKAIRILQKNKKYWDEKSEAYEMILSILKDSSEE